jgi:hypothetical protein
MKDNIADFTQMKYTAKISPTPLLRGGQGKSSTAINWGDLKLKKLVPH